MRDIDIDIDQYGTVDQQLHQIVSYRIFTIGLVGMFDDILSYFDVRKHT